MSKNKKKSPPKDASPSAGTAAYKTAAIMCQTKIWRQKPNPQGPDPGLRTAIEFAPLPRFQSDPSLSAQPAPIPPQYRITLSFFKARHGRTHANPGYSHIVETPESRKFVNDFARLMGLRPQSGLTGGNVNRNLFFWWYRTKGINQ
jgi:hypothetical protein